VTWGHIAIRLLAAGIGRDRVYFGPRLASRDSLWGEGGIGCRVKVDGEVVHSADLTPLSGRR